MHFRCLGPDFSRFDHGFLQIRYSLMREKPNVSSKIFFRQLLFSFSSSSCFFDNISPMSRKLLTKSMTLGGTSKTHIFQKIHLFSYNLH